MRDPFASEGEPSLDASGECWAWYVAYQRSALLLETLAEDHFPDQESFNAWISAQTVINLRPDSAA